MTQNELSIRPGLIKLIEEITGSKLLDVGPGNKFFLNLTPKAKATKAKINKWDYIKLKSFCTAKETTKKMKRQPIKWEKIVSNHVSNKDIQNIQNTNEYSVPRKHSPIKK